MVTQSLEADLRASQVLIAHCIPITMPAHFSELLFLLIIV